MLWERKKVAAWHAIRVTAFQLFDDQGFDATTWESGIPAGLAAAGADVTYPPARRTESRLAA